MRCDRSVGPLPAEPLTSLARLVVCLGALCGETPMGVSNSPLPCGFLRGVRGLRQRSGGYDLLGRRIECVIYISLFLRPNPPCFPWWLMGLCEGQGVFQCFHADANMMQTAGGERKRGERLRKRCRRRPPPLTKIRRVPSSLTLFRTPVCSPFHFCLCACV